MPRSPEAFRAAFMLDPNVVFLNHGSFGAVPRAVFSYQDRLRRELEAEPVLFLGRRFQGRMERTREELGRYVGTETAALGLTSNATTAINAVGRSIALKRGDEILTTDHEYGAMLNLWREVADQSRARLVTAEIPIPVASANEIVDRLFDRVTGRTRVIFFSHITSLSALVFPVKEICRRARREGILTVVDGAHGPGHVDRLEINSIGADIYAGNCHKWMCAPRGSGFLAATPETRRWIRGPVVSWGWQWEGADAFQQRFSWAGTLDPTALLSLPAAIRFLERNDWDAVRKRCRAMIDETALELQERAGLTPLAPPALLAPQMQAFALPGRPDPVRLQRALWRRHRIEIPVEEVCGKVIARLSVQAYTRRRDCQALVEAMARLPK